MKSTTDNAPATGANPSTLTTAGQPAHLSPEQIEQAAQDVTGMISTARDLLLIGGPESIDGASYILDHAFQRMSREVQPAIEDQTQPTAPEAESAPKLTAVEDQPVRPGAILVDERRFYGALRILHDAIVATESTSIEDEGAHRALTVLSDALRDAADPARIGN